MAEIKKAVIPVAGLGTRFLPATKSVPKELLPLVDKPTILHIVEEAVESGIEDIIFVTGRFKSAIEEFFDHSYELEDFLLKQGKADFLKKIQKISTMANIVSIRQKNPLGLGHAVLSAQPVVGKEPFAVLLGDEVMQGTPPVTAQLAQIYAKEKKSVIAVMEVPQNDIGKYGIAQLEEATKKTSAVTALIEKPKPSETQSRWALPGRYIFTPAIFDCLKETKPAKQGEIQLTDAMVKLIAREGLLAHAFDGKRFDVGDKQGFVCANIEFALMHEEIGSSTKRYILELAERLKGR